MTAGNSCFLFLGPELGEKQAALAELRKKIPPDKMSGDNSYEETVYYAGETPAAVIVSALRNGSLFSQSRLFLIKNAENIKKKDEIDLLSSYIASPQSGTTLVLISDENGIARGLEKVIAPAARRVFYELSDGKKSEWVNNYFKNEGFSLTPDAVLTILEMVENNTAALRTECSRLAMFLGRDRVIDAEEAEKWLSHTREESAFTLFSRIACGDFLRSLQTLRVLMAAKTEPQAVFSGLLWCFRKLRLYVGLIESGVNDEWEFKKIGITAPGARRDYSAASGLYDSAGVETCISLTAEYDLKIRMSGAFPKLILMDEYLYRIHSAAARIK